MLKSRNSFFSESNMNSQVIQNPGNNFIPNYGYPQSQMQAQSASNSFYSGPVPTTSNYQSINSTDSTSDIENRLAKIERAINRLDSRITKLENQNQITTDDLNNSMYMV